MDFSIIIPAFNEENYLSATIDAIQMATKLLAETSDVKVETIVVDNNSVDGTAGIARSKGAIVVHEKVQGISRARNAGASCARGEILVFVDADVIVPENMLVLINHAMGDPHCVGGGADVDYFPKRRVVRAYISLWKVLSRLTDMVQGATQFCRKEVFEEVGGYDETAWIGEDVDFCWALKRYAKSYIANVRVIRELKVRPSDRRFDKWPLWRILVWTDPLFIAAFRRAKSVWGGWYSDPVR